MAGLGLILAMSATLYSLYSRWAPAFAAAFATIVAMVYYQCGVAHITYDFTQVLTAYALAAAYFAIRHHESHGGHARWAAVAGFCAALAFLTKQSNGAFVGVFTGIAVLLASVQYGRHHVTRSGLAYAVGAAAPVCVILVWLFTKGAFYAFVDQVYFGAV